MRPRLAALIVAGTAAAAPALAHTPVEGLDGFSGGLLHPLLVPSHALSLLALGLLASQQRPRHRLVLLSAFAAALALATMLIVQAFAFADAEALLLLGGLAAGLLAAIGGPLPLVLSLAPVTVIGLALQLDSVPVLLSVQATLLSLAGTALGACLALALVSGLASEPKRPWLRIGVRVLGSWAAASLALVLALKYLR